MNCDVRTGWERRIWYVPGTRDPVKVSDIGKHVPQDSIRVTSSRLNCEASSNGSLILALDTWQGHSSEHMPVRILTLTHQIHSWHPERGWFLFEWVWAPFEGVALVLCPPQPALGFFPRQHRDYWSRLHSRWHSEPWFSPPFREAGQLWFSMSMNE